MSSQHLSRAALPPSGSGQGQTSTGSTGLGTQAGSHTGLLHLNLKQAVTRGSQNVVNLLLQLGGDDNSREGDHSQDPPPGSSTGGSAPFRDDKQETVMVRPYPQIQTLSQTPALPQHVPIQPSPPVTVSNPSVHLPQGQQTGIGDGSVKVITACFLVFKININPLLDISVRMLCKNCDTNFWMKMQCI